MKFKVQKGNGLKGEITVPGDKSISHRAILLASLADGNSEISGFLEGEDCLATIEVFQKMGVNISRREGVFVVEGKGLKGLKDPSSPLNFGNSGTSVRLCSGVLAAQEFSSTLIGDSSLSSRPMTRITEPLGLMGANTSSTEEGTLPIRIEPVDSLKSIKYSLPVPSAQVKSCLLFAGLYSQGITEIEEKIATRDHTERMFEQFGIPIDVSQSKAAKLIKLNKVEAINPTNIDICGDFSSASFFILAALITPNSELLLKNIGVNPTRIGFLHALRHMGANIELQNEIDSFEPTADILVRTSSLKGITLNTNLVANMIDEMPAFFIAAALAEGTTKVKDAKELRTKESDRLQVMSEALDSFGVKFRLEDDGIIINGLGKTGSFKTAEINSYGDHRIAMASSIGALRSDGETSILDCFNINTSFPNFIDVCKEIGINIEKV
ncbi:MAG: 3-phosphoshikimate 1-carboxyvinyltransferase [Gammaproteobacteria bacterium]|nr:MAG: 3-phosphoshikimate 1-carboxyvinyltransferase [Gammaproteobacteria bacterium]